MPDAPVERVQVRPCPNTKFGDYQTNALMGIARQRGMNPRDLAQSVRDRLDLGDVCEQIEIAGGGFLNFRISENCLRATLQDVLAGHHLFCSQVTHPKRVVIDFSSPNVAKSMHVGHIRSTILGDCLARIHRFVGNHVITDNHIGDWGTQFGKLLHGWKSILNAAAFEANPIDELERIYKEVNEAADKDPDLMSACRMELVQLQNGDPENLAIWHQMIDISRQQFDKIYRRLGIHFDHTLGESAYNDALPGVVEDLLKSNIASESDGATVVFFPHIKEMADHPAIIRKSDGGFNYASTDLATLDFRLSEFQPDQIIYVTDGRQQLHFKQIFEIFRRWKPTTGAQLDHVWFGAILGDDGKPFKTRSGGTIKLADLLNEAEERALAVVKEKNPDMDESLQISIASKIGLGAIKYADLLPNRNSDYRFSWDKMLAFQGNTAVYLLYANTRITSLLRKAGNYQPQNVTFQSLHHPAEWILARKLINFGFILETVLEESRPNYLCNYLYELASDLSSFYDQCPVLIAEGESRIDRLGLCQVAGMVLTRGLELLGIETVEKM